MKSLKLEANGVLALEERPLPKPGQGQCLIRVKACGVCSTDIYRSHAEGAYFYPLVMGHEISGQIEAIGEDASGFSVGDNVAIFPLIPCFKCQECQNENYMLCHDYSYHGSRCEGGYAEFIAVNTWNLINIPPHISIVDAAFLEPTAVVVRAIRKAKLWEGSPQRILIVGSGFLGLILAHALLSRNAGHDIWVLDRNPFKLKKLPAQVNTLSSSEDIYNKTFDVIFEGTGSKQGMDVSIDQINRGGLVCLFGNPTVDMVISTERMSQILRKEASFQGVWNSSYKHAADDDWAFAISLIEEGLSPSKFVSHELTLETVPAFLSNCWDHKCGTTKFEHIKGIIKQ